MVNDEAFYNNLLGTVRDADEVIREVKSGKGTDARLVSGSESGLEKGD